MRSFYIRTRGLDTEEWGYDSNPRVKSLVTIGGGGGGNSGKGPNRVFNNPTDRGTTTTRIDGGTGDWERLYDEDGNGGAGNPRRLREIRADYTYTVELEILKGGTAANAA